MDNKTGFLMVDDFSSAPILCNYSVKTVEELTDIVFIKFVQEALNVIEEMNERNGIFPDTIIMEDFEYPVKSFVQSGADTLYFQFVKYLTESDDGRGVVVLHLSEGTMNVLTRRYTIQLG